MDRIVSHLTIKSGSVPAGASVSLAAIDFSIWTRRRSGLRRCRGSGRGMHGAEGDPRPVRRLRLRPVRRSVQAALVEMNSCHGFLPSRGAWRPYTRGFVGTNRLAQDCPAPSRLLDRLLQLRPGAELRHRLGRDLDRLAVARVAPLACGAMDGGEFAEAGQPDLVAGGHLLGDLLESGVDRALGLTDLETAPGGHSSCQLILVDDSHVASLVLYSLRRCGLAPLTLLAVGVATVGLWSATARPIFTRVSSDAPDRSTLKPSRGLWASQRPAKKAVASSIAVAPPRK